MKYSLPILSKADLTMLVVGFCLGVSAIAVFFLPEVSGYGPLFNYGISSALGLLIWCSFRLIAPKYYTRTWIIAELIVVPLLSILAIVALGWWFSQLALESRYFTAVL